jgi:chitinase
MAQLKFLSRQRAVYDFYLSFVIAATVSTVGADFHSAQYGSPVPCESSGWNPTAWTYYHDLQAFQLFKQPILFDICVNNAVNDTQSHVTFRACTPQNTDIQPSTQSPAGYNSSKVNNRRNANTGPSSLNQGNDENSVNSATNGLLNYLRLNPTQSTMLSYQGNTVAGFHISPDINVESAMTAIDKFANQPSTQMTQRAIQQCGAASKTNDTVSSGSFGFVLDTQGDVAAVQSVLANWAAGECLHGDQNNSTWWSNISVSSSPGSTGSSNITRHGDFTSSNITHHGNFTTESTCKYIQANAGDGCWALAQRCGITQAQFESYNGGSGICSTVQVDQYVCCSAGSLPDFSPQPTNGNCFPYTIQTGDFCAAIAKTHQMQVSVIENNNNLTWGWMGCNDLQIGQTICLSPGKPPFPANVPNSVCGPQVNNTTPTPDPTTWAGLNPCPLNACCDIWGQCGITSEFCTAGTANTGAPGTAQPGSNGCISNCGTQIVTSAAPNSFARIGYFEAFNTQRPCLHMWVCNA